MEKCQGELNREKATHSQKQKPAAISREKSGWSRGYKAGVVQLLVRRVDRGHWHSSFGK